MVESVLECRKTAAVCSRHRARLCSPGCVDRVRCVTQSGLIQVGGSRADACQGVFTHGPAKASGGVG